MEMAVQILSGIVGLVMLYYGAEWLVSGGVGIAGKLKIPSLVVGLTLVAFGTSAPELVVSIDAALTDHGDISIGNVIGSNICNIGLILGLCAVICPLRVNKAMFKLDMPLMMVSAIVLAVFLLSLKGLTRWCGLVFFASVVAYTGWSIYSGRKNVPAEEENAPEISKKALWLLMVMVIGGLAILVGGAKLLVNSAVYIAGCCGVSQAVIGLTVVAIGTSLPELATSVVASLKGESDIAIGNVVGSNIFNVLAILGIAPLISPIKIEGIEAVDMAVMLAVCAGVYLFAFTGSKINRPEGAALLLTYLGYMAYLVAR